MFFCLQNRISTYDFPMFCENEKSIHPTTHMCVSHPKSNISQLNHGENPTGLTSRTSAQNDWTNTLHTNLIEINAMSEKKKIPLFKSVSLQVFAIENQFSENMTPKYKQKPKQNGIFTEKTDKCFNNSISNANILQRNSYLPVKSSKSMKPYIESNRYNDSESSSSSDLVDLTSKKNVPVSEMYNEDIDYMNNYLKSLPDYDELNRKISNEQQKCEDIYDRLICINSSLKSNRLPKSNSYHSISTTLIKPDQSFSANNGTVKNKLFHSLSSSTVNHSLINSPDSVGFIPIKPMNSAQIKEPRVPSKSKSNFIEMNKLPTTLLKSASSTSLQRSSSKQGLNDFWSHNLAKSTQQKLGWNYNKIMANKSNGIGSNSRMANNNIEETSEITGYKLQKNMSLSHLGQKIQQNVSRKELYDIMCNNEVDQSKKITQNILDKKKNLRCSDCKQKSNSYQFNQSNQLFQQSAHILHNQKNELSKSFSQTSVPSFTTQYNEIKSSKKTSIPTLFKTSLNSTTGTQFDLSYPQENFAEKSLVKSLSSSSIGKLQNTKNENMHNKPITNTFDMRSNGKSVLFNRHDKIYNNNDLFNIQNTIPVRKKSSSNKQDDVLFFTTRPIPEISQNCKFDKTGKNSQTLIHQNISSSLCANTHLNSSNISIKRIR